MNRKNAGALTALIALIVILSFVGAAMAGVLSWSAPTKYVPVPPATVGDPIPSSKISQIVYRTWYGSSSTGPWTAGAVTGAGVLSATVPDPAKGSTSWYTVEAFLDNAVSAKAGAVSKTIPFPETGSPTNLKIQ